jgi:soluble lytic murein transglycosylase-like protein
VIVLLALVTILVVGTLLSRGIAAAPGASVPYDSIFSALSVKHKVPKRLMVSIVAHESKFNASAVNRETAADRRKGRDVDSIGLCQILFPDTAQAYRPGIARELLTDPQTNLEIGYELMRDLLRRYTYRDPEFPDRAVAAYNAGTPRFNSDGTFRNQTYVDAVKRQWEGYADV